MTRSKTLKPLKPGRTERQVSDQIVEAARLFGDALEFNRQNVGGMTNARGRYVPFNEKFDSDFRGMVRRGPNAGRKVLCEIKKEFFDPAKARGEERERFDGQLAKLKATNEGGGLGFWCSDSADFTRVVQRILETPNIRIVFEDDYPYLEIPEGEDEPR